MSDEHECPGTTPRMNYAEVVAAYRREMDQRELPYSTEQVSALEHVLENLFPEQELPSENGSLDSLTELIDKPMLREISLELTGFQNAGALVIGATTRYLRRIDKDGEYSVRAFNDPLNTIVNGDALALFLDLGGGVSGCFGKKTRAVLHQYLIRKNLLRTDS